MKLTGLARLGQNTDNQDKYITSMDNIDRIAHHYRIYFTSREGRVYRLSQISDTLTFIDFRHLIVIVSSEQVLL